MHRPPKKLNPIAVPESVFPEPMIKPENSVDTAFLDNLLGGIALLNRVCVERIGSLLQAAKGEREKLKGGHASIHAVKEVTEAAKEFTAAATDLEKRTKFNELMQNPERVEALIAMIEKVPGIDAEEKESMTRSLREMSERYLEFGPVGLLNELELAKTARMLDTVITTIQYYLAKEKNFGEMFKTSLELYLMQLERYREFIANRMVYFLEIRQEKLHATKKEDFGFGDLCRSWMVLDRAPPDEKIAHQFDNMMERFITKKSMQTKWQEGEIDLMQSLPQNPLSDHPSSTNINDYFYLYVNQFGGSEARMRLLGCGASLSPEYRDDSWGAWFSWASSGVRHAVAAVKKIPKAVLPAKKTAHEKVAVEDHEAPVMVVSDEDVRRNRNKRMYEGLINLTASVSRYMRPVPEECMIDTGGALANARDLILTIQRARWNYQGEYYGDLCQRAYLSILQLIFYNMIDHAGTPRAKLFMKLFSETISSYANDNRTHEKEFIHFDGDANLNMFYDRVGRIDNAEEAVMQAILLCVKYKNYAHHDPMVVAHFYALAKGLIPLKFMCNQGDHVVIQEVASLMLQLRDCAGGDFKREIDDFIRDRLGCDPAKLDVKKESQSAFVDQYELTFRNFERLFMLRQVYFSDDASIAGHRKIIRRPPLFLLEIYEKRIRNELLCDVVRKLLHDKKYEIPKDLLIETRNYLAHKIKSDSSDFVSHAAYLCLECAMVSRSSRHEKVLIAALQDLGRIETEYYQHPADEKGFTERSQHEIALARKNNEYERLQHVRELLKKLPIVKARSSSDLYIPNVRLEALRKDIDQRLSELKREISELAPSGDVTVRK